MTRKEGRRPDLKRTADDISAETGIPAERMNIFEEVYPEGASYTASGNYEPIVCIAACRKNGQEWIQRLMAAAAKTVAEQLLVPRESVSVYVSLIDEGYLLVDGRFL